MSISKHNRKGSLYTYDADTKSWPFRKLDELAAWERSQGKEPGSYVYIVRRFFVTESKFGPSIVAVVPAGDGTGALVNLPSHLDEVIDEIEADPESIEQINTGHAGFRLRGYADRNNVQRWSVEFVDA